MNLKDLKELFKLLEKTDITEFEFERDGERVKVERKGKVSLTQAHEMVLDRESGEDELVAQKPVKVKDQPEGSLDDGQLVLSPFVGTFYRSPSPAASPFVEIGHLVHKGQALCIIEAMKLMNEIECDFNGKITHIYVQNGQTVEYGQKLFRVKA